MSGTGRRNLTLCACKIQPIQIYNPHPLVPDMPLMPALDLSVCGALVTPVGEGCACILSLTVNDREGTGPTGAVTAVAGGEPTLCPRGLMADPG